MSATLTHVLGRHVDCEVDGKPLFRYVYNSEVDMWESPKPHFRSLRDLNGNELVLFRPHDHHWHHGLAMAEGYVSGHNFWGGGTFVRESMKYESLPNQGRIDHVDWQAMEANDAVELVERCAWIGHDESTLMDEVRTMRLGGIDRAAGRYTLSIGFHWRNIWGKPIVIGSPTTSGRDNAGYGGLAWRGPRSFLKGRILAGNGLEGPDIMGQRAPWLAYQGAHDTSGDHTTLIFLEDRQNPYYPNQWFVRNEPFALVVFAFAFSEERTIEPGAELTQRYKIIVANGTLDREQIEGLVHEE